MTEFQQVIAGMLVALFAALLVSVALVYSRIRSMELRIAELSVQVSPLWAQVQSRIAKELHHPHKRYKEMDVLLEKLETKPLALDSEERLRLKELLKLRAKDMHLDITNGQRSSAVLMLGVMDKVLEEAAMADFAINDASTSCKHENQIPGNPCAKCGKVVPVNPGAVAEEWAGDANTRKKNA